MTNNKQAYLQNLMTQDGIISALAIDQRGALKKMIQRHKSQPATDIEIETFKTIVSEELTPFASSILLDPEYGLKASKHRADTAGLLLAYEKTGYDATVPGRLPDILDLWSVKRLKEQHADACKFLLYYDVDEDVQINARKKAFVERLGAECEAESLPFFLELVSYDAQDNDTSTKAYALKKPHKVNEMMKEFSQPQYRVDVLKVEVPVNMNYVEGYATGDVAYTKEEAMTHFKAQSDATHLPYIFLSAGVSSELFVETLKFAKEAESNFNGVLCGRATWANGVEIFVKEGEDEARKWMQTVGKANIQALNDILKVTANPIS
ncbi:tagatose-bisphosphate aldolase [Staphylococcus massiliensis]|uniref:Tagatose 1,6-diphosphate aldolase n=1 Tax=Staphylococcus massiliensis S46 TaxID=1229783 RepID=K9AEN2_9STAP|nr:tagatose-bisphosphate aldolase [Staphylococcus massiliensis]EKU45733.1 tagatose 1,6-diphosphate aldolase [Staphylococcus massiliensis S46]MCG3400415.1 tagatose-bisphosphate aldolase [Staphylococcus massiliensis]POA01336.1 tagatose-bisphosphate aldolase [Staphylococcus massiliensis CCUG 55927]